MADGARLESVFTVTGNGGSNPPLSATLLIECLRGSANSRLSIISLDIELFLSAL